MKIHSIAKEPRNSLATVCGSFIGFIRTFGTGSCDENPIFHAEAGKVFRNCGKMGRFSGLISTCWPKIVGFFYCGVGVVGFTSGAFLAAGRKPIPPGDWGQYISRFLRHAEDWVPFGPIKCYEPWHFCEDFGHKTSRHSSPY